mmetsp:Transcript_42547/g.35727  ORF Transcript_42547/g.35727 Transcript_42547/m.35727 type:complete len:103 (-) Transcript_42547:1306-1614(-)
MRLSLDEKTLYSGSNGKMKKWDIATGDCTQTYKGHDNLVNSILLSLDESSLYSGSTDGKIKKWNIVTGECIQTIDVNSGGMEMFLLLSLSGRTIYSGCHEVK